MPSIEKIIITCSDSQAVLKALKDHATTSKISIVDNKLNKQLEAILVLKIPDMDNLLTIFLQKAHERII